MWGKVLNDTDFLPSSPARVYVFLQRYFKIMLSPVCTRTCPVFLCSCHLPVPSRSFASLYSTRIWLCPGLFSPRSWASLSPLFTSWMMNLLSERVFKANSIGKCWSPCEIEWNIVDIRCQLLPFSVSGWCPLNRYVQSTCGTFTELQPNPFFVLHSSCALDCL